MTDKAAKEEAEHDNRLSAEVRRNLENDNRPQIERDFEDLLDELASNPSRAANTNGASATEREEAERGIRDFCNAMFRTLDQSLQSDSLKVNHVLAEEDGIVVTAEDGMRNSWSVTITWEGLEQTRQNLGGEDGPRLLSAVAGRALLELRNARERWWRGRMPLKRSGRIIH